MAAPLSRKDKELGREKVWGGADWDHAPELPDVIDWAVDAMKKPTKRWPASLRDHPDVRPFVEALAALEKPYNKFIAAIEFTDAEKAEEDLERERANAPRILKDAELQVKTLKEISEHIARTPPRDYPAEIAAQEARVKRCKELLGVE